MGTEEQSFVLDGRFDFRAPSENLRKVSLFIRIEKLIDLSDGGLPDLGGGTCQKTGTL